MRKGLKNILKRVLFWSTILAAPVAFILMLSFYVNSYLTSDRVVSILTPLFEGVSGSKVSIGSADLHVGLKSTLVVEDVSFYGEHPICNINLIKVRFNTPSIFLRTMEIDSVVVKGMTGEIRFGTERRFEGIRWRDRDENGSFTINLQLSALENISVKSFHLLESHFLYLNKKYDLGIHFLEYSHEINADLVALMNILLVRGSVQGLLTGDDGEEIPFGLSGRMQVNMGDEMAYVRDGEIKLFNNRFRFSAFIEQDEGIVKWRIFIDDNNVIFKEALDILPVSLKKFLDNAHDLPVAIELAYTTENHDAD